VTTQEIIRQELSESLEKLKRKIKDYESAVQGLKYNIENLEDTLDQTRDDLEGFYAEVVFLTKKLAGTV